MFNFKGGLQQKQKGMDVMGFNKVTLSIVT